MHFKMWCVVGITATCWRTFDALCSTRYGTGGGGVHKSGNTRPLFTCGEGTFLRSVIVASYSTGPLTGFFFECSDGSISDIFGQDVPNHYVASCPDGDGYGIQSIDMRYEVTDRGTNLFNAEIYCADDQPCVGWICSGEDGVDCTDSRKGAEFCGPIGRSESGNASFPGCPDDYYSIGARVSVDDRVEEFVMICASIESCPLDREPSWLSRGINQARVAVGGVVALVFIMGVACVVYQKRKGIAHESEEVFKAVCVGVFTTVGGGVAEALAGAWAAAIGFAVTSAFGVVASCYFYRHTRRGRAAPADNDDIQK